MQKKGRKSQRSDCGGASKGKVQVLPATAGTYPGALGISESRNVLAAKPNCLQPTA